MSKTEIMDIQDEILKNSGNYHAIMKVVKRYENNTSALQVIINTLENYNNF